MSQEDYGYSLADIERLVAPVAKKYGIERMYLFGSRARGDHNSSSDYDFSIDPGKLVRYSDYLAFIDELSEIFGSHVDVVSRRGIRRDRFYENMVSDEVMVYAVAA